MRILILIVSCLCAGCSSLILEKGNRPTLKFVISEKQGCREAIMVKAPKILYNKCF